jgi:hypothetical protein
LACGLVRNGQVPGQQITDVVDGVIGDLTEHGAQIEFRIEAVELGRSCRVSDYAEAEHTVLSWY